MKQRILSLLVLLLTVASSAWAQATLGVRVKVTWDENTINEIGIGDMQSGDSYLDERFGIRVKIPRGGRITGGSINMGRNNQIDFSASEDDLIAGIEITCGSAGEASTFSSGWTKADGKLKWEGNPSQVVTLGSSADDNFVNNITQIEFTLVTGYALNVSENEHGKVTFKVRGNEVTAADEGDKILMEITPDAGWEVYEPIVHWGAAMAKVPALTPDAIPTLIVTEPEKTVAENTWSFSMERADGYVSVSYRKLLTNTDITISNITAPTYNGQEQKPAITVKDGTKTLVEGTDYTVAYTNNINAALSTAGDKAPTVTITAVETSEFYAGSTSRTFTINKKALEASMIAAIDPVTFTGSAFTPEPAVTYNGMTLVKGTDFTYSYSNNVNAGTATVTITAVANGNYSGSARRTFTINKKDLTITADNKQVTYGDAAPTYTVSYDGFVGNQRPNVLGGRLSYACSYVRNTSGVGTYDITPSGLTSNNYAITFVKGTLTVTAKALANSMIAPIDDETYTGAELTPAPVLTFNGMTLVKDRDYTEAYTYNINAGTATVTLTGIGNYTGTASRTFTINPKELEKSMVQPIADRVYTGLNIKPELTVRDGSKPLVKGVDYTTEYEDFTAAGTAKVTVTGIGNYTGTVVRNYNILQRSLADVMMEPIEDQTYTGDAIEPALKLTFDGQALKAGTDYTATYEDNVIAGTAKVTVTGTGSYNGTLTAEFTINPRTTIDGNITLVEDGVETELTINDAGTQQGKTVEEDLEVTTLNYYRTLKASDVNAYTICLPYAPPTDPNLKYYTLTSVDGTALHFDEIEGEPQAFTPYLVMASADVDISKEGYKETFTMSKEVANTSVAGSYVMKGTLSGIQHDDAVGLYIMQAGNRWAKVGSNTKAYIPPFRAYIEVTSAVPERLDSTIGGENSATEITSVCATDEDGTEHWFDLSGHPIEKPTKSGIYIHNGRKEYVK